MCPKESWANNIVVTTMKFAESGKLLCDYWITGRCYSFEVNSVSLDSLYSPVAKHFGVWFKIRI
jgi:hypothetical protein